MRGLGLTVVALLGLSCVSVRPRPPELFEVCQETLRRGVFHAESLACFPELASPLEDLLCAGDFTTHRELNALGFGYGAWVLGQTLREADPSVRAIEPLDPEAAWRWGRAHCAGSQARGAQDVAELHVRALDLLPASLVGPWRSCRGFLASESRVRCILHGSFDLTGEGETVLFEAAHSPEDPMEFGTRLRKDLEVKGADCGGERWRAWTRISARAPRLLRCRRQGRSAVSIRLTTGKGVCEGRLPELTERPWQELCPTP